MPTLLLADGSTIIRRVMELTFSSADVRVVAVADGEDAIGRIAAEPPDIVLADIATPTRSGYEICTFVKQHPELAAIPVLLLAGALEPVDDDRAKQAGCDGIIVKPFEPQQVVARVKELLAGARGEATYVPGVPRPVERLAPRSGAAPSTPEGTEPPADADTASGAAVPTRNDNDVERYFERLDAAMAAKRESTPAASDGPREDAALAEVPTLDRVLGEVAGETAPGTPVTPLPALAHVMPPPIEPADATPTLSPAPTAPVARTGDESTGTVAAPTPIADAFSALLAVELGEPGAKPVRLTTAPPELVATETLVDEVTRRVVERLAPDAVSRVVADIVSEVAERLVREEIARIREATNPKSQLQNPKSQEG